MWVNTIGIAEVAAFAASARCCRRCNEEIAISFSWSPELAGIPVLPREPASARGAHGLCVVANAEQVQALAARNPPHRTLSLPIKPCCYLEAMLS